METALSLNNLAGNYHSQGRYSEAEPLYSEALKICERRLGVNHSNTVLVRDNLTALKTLQYKRSNKFRLLILLAIIVFLVICLLKGQWLLALGGVAITIAIRWGKN